MAVWALIGGLLAGACTEARETLSPGRDAGGGRVDGGADARSPDRAGEGGSPGAETGVADRATADAAGPRQDAGGDRPADRPQTTDAPAAGADAGCPGGTQACLDGRCADHRSTLTCGQTCTACPVPANALVATCDGTTCGFTCKPGFHRCADRGCVPDDAPATCGDRCTPCPAPVDGTAVCEDRACAAKCPTGKKLCAGACIPQDRACNGACPSGTRECQGVCLPEGPAACGSSCRSCPVPANAQAASCTAGVCGVVCKPDHVDCQGACVPRTGCCRDAECMRDNADGTCVSNQCRFTCRDGFKPCASRCIPASACCNDADCAARAPANGRASCNTSHQCVLACNKGFVACGDGTCAGAASCCGLAATCGANGNEDCCTHLEVPGGTFHRTNDSSLPATVSAFRLDKFEVTVARFRKFVKAGYGHQGNPPAAGAGSVPGAGSDTGWRVDLKSNLPASTAELQSQIKGSEDGSDPCNFVDFEGTANDALPMNCVELAEALAFCIWDGGRLPSDAEWNFAAAAGSSQRIYPWGAQDDFARVQREAPGRVGSKPAGNGLFGHANLAGNVAEWVRDSGGEFPKPCNNCCAIDANADGYFANVRGGSFRSSQTALFSTTVRQQANGLTRSADHGLRCARAP